MSAETVPPSPEEPLEAGPPPPYDAEAEESLIGSMLLTRAAREDAVRIVRAEDFYLPRNARLYAAIGELVRRGTPVDVTTLDSWLREHDSTPPIERSALLRIQAATPSSVNAYAYATIVAERASRRRLAYAAGAIRDLAYDPDVDAALAVERATELLARADVPLGGRPAPLISEFLAKTAEHRWVWPGILEAQERLLLVAREGGGKTTLIRQLAVCLSQGLDPLRQTKIPTVLVYMLDLENPESIARRKIGAMLDALNTLERPVDTTTYRIDCRPEGIDLCSRPDFSWVHERIGASIAAWHAVGWPPWTPVLVAIGPVYKMHDEENNPVEVRKVQKALDLIRTRFDCALVMETHAPHEVFSTKAPVRALRPSGPRLWLRWPDFCRAIEPATGVVAETPDGRLLSDFYDVRPGRDERDWPTRLRRGGRLPWLEDQGI